jgi:hypothetical protein
MSRISGFPLTKLTCGQFQSSLTSLGSGFIIAEKGGHQMRENVIAVGFICLMSVYCARAPQGETVRRSELSRTAPILARESVAYDDVTADELINGVKKALADLRVTRYTTNAAARRIMAPVSEKLASYDFAEYTVREPGKPDEVIRKTESRQTTLYLLLEAKENNGGSALSAIVSGDNAAAARGKAVLGRFLDLLNKNLKK